MPSGKSKPAIIRHSTPKRWNDLVTMPKTKYYCIYFKMNQKDEVRGGEEEEEKR